MTIREALDQYRDQGPQAVHEGYRDAVELLVRNHIGTALENDCYLDALYLTDLMFRRTNENLNILTGDGADQFIEALRNSFEKALGRIRNLGGKARMIILASEVPAAVSEIQSRFQDVFEIRRGQLKPGAEVNHMIACDGTMIRIEEPHAPLNLDSDSGTVKAKVFFDNTEEVKKSVGFFNAAWSILGA
jgi:hypothetical protein